MPKVTHVKHARKAQPQYGIAVGDEYWWWQFRNAPVSISKRPPKRWELTRSEYYQWLYRFEDETIAELPADESLADVLASIVSDVESQRDELQEKLDAMPGQLQESSVLNERIESLDSYLSELGNVDVDNPPDPDDADLRAEVIEELGGSPTEDEIKDAIQEKIDTYWEEARDEAQAISVE